jgi:hypothetical protein
MKKIAVLVAVVLVFGMMLSACHSNEKCPAYSKNKTEKQHPNS